MENLEIGKQAAAFTAIDEYLQDESVIGIGSGATVAYAVKRIAERARKENLRLICIAGSYTARELILENDLILGDVEKYPKIDFTIDGADEVDNKLNVINGSGGCFCQGKIISSCSKELIIVADHTKSVKNFGGPGKRAILIEVIPLANLPVKEKIESSLGGIVKLRIAPKTSKYGPVVTDNGNYLLDWDFPSNIKNWEQINKDILLIPGVVETGIFINLATKAYFGMDDGSVKIQSI